MLEKEISKQIKELIECIRKKKEYLVNEYALVIHSFTTFFYVFLLSTFEVTNKRALKIVNIKLFL